MESVDYVPYDTRPYGAHQLLLRYADHGRRVLDVGASSGYLAAPLSRQGKDVVGVELDAEAGKAAERFTSAMHVGDVETMDFGFAAPGAFDVVLCGDLIEHLRDPGAFLAKVRPLIAPGGRLVASTPNVANWAIRLSLLAGRFRYTDRGILDRTHAHLFTRRTLEETFARAGYRVTTLDVTVPLPVGRGGGLEALAHRIGALRPGLFAYQFVVVAEPAR